MFVHVFGAYFGLALARMLYTKDLEDCSNEGAVYHSDIFSMIGELCLSIFRHLCSLCGKRISTLIHKGKPIKIIVMFYPTQRH